MRISPHCLASDLTSLVAMKVSDFRIGLSVPYACDLPPIRKMYLLNRHRLYRNPIILMNCLFVTARSFELSQPCEACRILVHSDRAEGALVMYLASDLAVTEET